MHMGGNCPCSSREEQSFPKREVVCSNHIRDAMNRKLRRKHRSRKVSHIVNLRFKGGKRSNIWMKTEGYFRRSKPLKVYRPDRFHEFSLMGDKTFMKE